MDENLVVRMLYEDLHEMWSDIVKCITDELGFKLLELDEESLYKNALEFLKNDYYMEMYDDAPSIECKFSLAVLFCMSYDSFIHDKENTQLQEDCDLLDEMGKWCLAKTDWQYYNDRVVQLESSKKYISEVLKLFDDSDEKIKAAIPYAGSMEILNPYYKNDKIKSWHQETDSKYSVCSKCGAILDIQEGFDPEKYTHICKKCGEHLLNEKQNEWLKNKDIYWTCDGCGDCLNEQEGFTDFNDIWVCTKCGFINDVTIDNIKE